MNYTGDAQLPQRISASLIHREIQLYADRANFELLHFKGAVAYRQFPDRESGTADADILCAPDSADAFAEILTQYGWQRAEQKSKAEAITLVHPERAASVDLYRHCPGLHGDWRHTFQALRQAREYLTNGYPHVPAPSLLDHGALLLAAIAAGGDTGGKHSRNRIAIESQIPSAERVDFYQRMRELGLIDTIFPTGGKTAGAARRRRLAAVNSSNPARRAIGGWFYRIADAASMQDKLAALKGTRAAQAQRSTPITGKDHPGRIADNIVWTLDAEEQLALLNLADGTPIRLLGSACQVWQLLALDASDEEIVETFQQEVANLPGDAAHQILQTIHTLGELGLLADAKAAS